MLVLSRKKSETIVINNEVAVQVVEIRGDKVRLGVEAPKEIPVHRGEVYDLIKRNEIGNKYKEFQDYLDRGDFKAAYDFYRQNNLSLNTPDSHKLIGGLGELVTRLTRE
jgi:carbon storage regulator